jgi:predicted amino acid racemase
VRIEVDCERIRCNAEAIVAKCAACSIEVVGVTKVCCGHPDVARAILSGGVRMLGESRLSNVRRLRDAGIEAPVMLLRAAPRSEAEEVVRLTQVSLNSEVETVRALSRAARRAQVSHQVILMVEIGDRREGVMPDEAVGAAREISHLPCVELVGVGANVGCVGGVVPTRKNTQAIIDIAHEIERAVGVHLPIISGGHTTSLGLVRRGEMPKEVNQLRVGGGIVLGMNSADPGFPPSPYPDAFVVVAEVIEVRTKPSLPEGSILYDAFMRRPEWADLGPRRRAILAMGEQDLHTAGLRPKRSGITLVSASSDHMVLDVTEADPPVELGEEMAFMPNYLAVATAMAGFDVVRAVTPARLAG